MEHDVDPTNLLVVVRTILFHRGRHRTHLTLTWIQY